MKFESLLKQKGQEVDEILRRVIDGLPEDKKGQPIREAMAYNLLAPGKRLRPILLLETFRMLHGIEIDAPSAFAAALEMIHTYSLIHDDLPAMDDDDLRRGRKTTHVVYGEAMAILTGDALLTHGLLLGAKGASLCQDKEAGLRALCLLASSAGVPGMLGGQVADLAAETDPPSYDQLVDISRKKTGALFSAAFGIGSILAGADTAIEENLKNLGVKLGLAFQMQDDLLDVIGDAKKLGKPLYSDEKNHKVTFVTLLGQEETERQARCLFAEVAEGLSACLSSTQEPVFLVELVRYLQNRER